MRYTLLVFLMLCGLAVGEPELFQSDNRVLGHVLLVAEDGDAEASALARIGYNCAVSHAHSLQQLEADEAWTRERAGWEIPTSKNDWTTKRNDLTVIGLGNRSPLAWRHDGGVICIDPAPKLAAYFDVIPSVIDVIVGRPIRCFWDPAYGRTCENSLYTEMPLFLGDPTHGVPIELGPNNHAPAGSLVEDDSPQQKEVRRWLAIHQPLPVLGFSGARYRRSPNWDVRNLAAEVDTVLLRPSFTTSLEEAEERLIDDKEPRVSAHYVVGRDGQFVQMVDERWAAWPDGRGGRGELEERSIVIQVVSQGGSKEDYTEKQREVVAKLVGDLRTRWNIPDDRILGKSEQ